MIKPIYRFKHGERVQDGWLSKTASGHRYELGTSHQCGFADCPANNGNMDTHVWQGSTEECVRNFFYPPTPPRGNAHQ